MHGSLDFINPVSSSSKNSTCGAVTFLCDLFYCPESSGHSCPSALSPCHQLWQSQPLFLQWEAAFFQRDDLLCLYRGWHWGHDPTQGLDSTHRMLWTKFASCHPSSAVRMCSKPAVLHQEAKLIDPSVRHSWHIKAQHHYQHLHHLHSTTKFCEECGSSFICVSRLFYLCNNWINFVM